MSNLHPVLFDVWWEQEIASRFADVMPQIYFDTMKTVARHSWRRGADHAMTTQKPSTAA